MDKPEYSESSRFFGGLLVAPSETTVRQELNVGFGAIQRMRRLLWPFTRFPVRTLSFGFRISGFGPRLPTVHRPVELPVNRQIRPLVGILRRQRFIKINSQSRRIPRMHHPVRKTVLVRENAVRLIRMPHIFLD